MYDHSCGLIHDQEVVVFINDVDGYGLGAYIGGGRRRNPDHDRLTAAQPQRRPPDDLTGYCDMTLPNPLLDARA
jgi:hypothetical protein